MDKEFFYLLGAIFVLSIIALFLPTKCKVQKWIIPGSIALALITTVVLLVSSECERIVIVTNFVQTALFGYVLANSALWFFDKFLNYSQLPWYQKKKLLLSEEDDAIRSFEPKAERSFEEEKLVYTVITDKHICRQEHPLAYQMIFDPNYPKNGQIQFYLIMPDLNELFTPQNGLRSTRIRSDEQNDAYLDIISDSDVKLTGADAIKRFYQWVDLYNCHRAGDTSNINSNLKL